MLLFWMHGVPEMKLFIYSLPLLVLKLFLITDNVLLLLFPNAQYTAKQCKRYKKGIKSIKGTKSVLIQEEAIISSVLGLPKRDSLTVLNLLDTDPWDLTLQLETISFLSFFTHEIRGNGQRGFTPKFILGRMYLFPPQGYTLVW